MKKILVLILCAVMALSLLAGCGGSGGKSDNPDAGEKVTLTIGIPKHSSVSDYDNNYYTQWLEEKTDYEIKFQFFAASQNDYKTQLSAMVASTNVEMPDILMGFDLGSDLHNRYGADGVFVDLASYFNDKEKSATWWEQYEKLDEDYADNIWRRMHTTDGTDAVYAFPEIQDSTIDTMQFTPWINQEWLDYLQLEMPTDLDSLYNVLVAFRDKDPNQNGLPDEIPLVGGNSLSGNAIQWIINMFIYSDATTYFNVDENGQLYSPYREDSYREALKYIAKLYDEGLMSPLTLTATPQDLRQMVCPAEGGAQFAGVVVTHLTLGFVADHAGMLSYEAMPLWGNVIRSENQNNYSTFITKDCENVDAAWELLMSMCTEESAIIQRYGIQGENWDYAPEGTTSIMGTEATIRVYEDIATTIGNQNWRNVEATFLFNAEGEGNQSVPEEETEVRSHKYGLFNEALSNYAYQVENHNPDDSLICPLLIWSDEYKEEVPYARDDCKTYITRARTDFITGKTDINDDGDWTEYLNELDKLGYEQWLFYSQTIYEETMAEQG